MIEHLEARPLRARRGWSAEAKARLVEETATKVGPGAHAIVILDQAGWHGVNFLA